MVNAAEMRTLVVARDPALIKHFTSISQELGIAAQRSEPADDIPGVLGRAKFEAVLLDFDTVPDALPILASVRESRGNWNALVFAVATGSSARQQALRQGANFLLARPIDDNEIRRMLQAAYNLMAQERRRYFRARVRIPVLLTHAGQSRGLQCETINLSSHGMAVETPVSLSPPQQVGIALFLPNANSALHGQGTVEWDDKQGKIGLRFECSLARDQTELDAWLDTQFEEQLHSDRDFSERNQMH